MSYKKQKQKQNNNSMNSGIKLMNRKNTVQQKLKNQTEILQQKKINEMKNAVESNGNRADNMEERVSVSELKDRNLQEFRVEEKRKLKLKKYEKVLQEPSNSTGKGNIRIMGITEGKEREKEAESLKK